MFMKNLNNLHFIDKIYSKIFIHRENSHESPLIIAEYKIYIQKGKFTQNPFPMIHFIHTSTAPHELVLCL